MEAKPFWQSKTIWVNVVALLVAIITSLNINPSWWPQFSIVALGIANVILRFLTGEPIDLSLIKKDSGTKV